MSISDADRDELLQQAAQGETIDWTTLRKILGASIMNRTEQKEIPESDREQVLQLREYISTTLDEMTEYLVLMKSTIYGSKVVRTGPIA